MQSSCTQHLTSIRAYSARYLCHFTHRRTSKPLDFNTYPSSLAEIYALFKSFEVKSKCCSCRGPKFDSQHALGISQPPVKLVWRGPFTCYIHKLMQAHAYLFIAHHLQDHWPHVKFPGRSMENSLHFFFLTMVFIFRISSGSFLEFLSLY